jgi:acyl-CoA reductase-like NAD-dependent aldehyde dehydrogenase
MIDGLECGKQASGFGRDLGPESLDGYLHSKAVIFEQS